MKKYVRKVMKLEPTPSHRITKVLLRLHQEKNGCQINRGQTFPQQGLATVGVGSFVDVFGQEDHAIAGY